ncbi:MAG: uroporphyrinogen decarboxylase family protein [Acidobacteriota bacterium]
MNSRERVETALNFELPDRTPVFATFVPEVEKKLRHNTGIKDFDLGAAMGNDMVKDCVGLEKSFYGQPEPVYTDDWGITWRYVKNKFGEYTEMIEFPLAGEKSKLENYQIPDPDEQSQYESFKNLSDIYAGEKWMVGSSQISIFEASWYLRGMENLLIDMVTDPQYVHILMDKVMQFPLNAAKNYIKLGADMVWFGDDVAMQSGMMISMDHWRTFLKPRFEKIFKSCKELNPDIKIAYHSCGNCEAVIDEMIEIGLDVLNPIQPLAINPFEIKKRYGKRLVLFGGLCVQRTMPLGTVQDVHNAVTGLKRDVGAGGGYILAPAHHIQADTPIENVMAFYDSALKPRFD